MGTHKFLINTDKGQRVVTCPDKAALRALEQMAARARLATEGTTFYRTGV